MKNLRFVGWRRCILWILLLISSPIHLIYNSAVFSALGTNEYTVLLAPADFNFKNPPDHDAVFANCFEQNVAMNMSDFYCQDFDELDKQTCIDTYVVDFVADRGTLILITNDLTAHNESLRWVSTGNDRYDYTLRPFKWMCNYLEYTEPDRSNCLYRHPDDFSVFSISWSPPLINAITPSNITLNQDNLHTTSSTSHRSGDDYDDLRILGHFMNRYPQEKDVQRHLDDPSHWKNSSWEKNITMKTTGATCARNTNLGSRYTTPFLGDALPVDRCLSQKVDEKCQLLFSLPICLTVIFCNAIKVMCMFLTAYDDRREIILTVGDAISSFLSSPDATTKGRCLLSKLNVTKGRQLWPNGFSARKPAILSNKEEMDKIREHLELDGHNHSLSASSLSLRPSSLHEYLCGKWRYHGFSSLEPGFWHCHIIHDTTAVWI